jgi:Holliday junction resolvase RusA-like endonuclease
MTTYILQQPPSLNAMYYNVAGKGRRKSHQYISWIRGELKALIAQRAKPFEGPAKVIITCPKTRGDIDNRIKPTLDLLVRAGVLRDDRSDYVRLVEIKWASDIQIMHVELLPCK